MSDERPTSDEGPTRHDLQKGEELRTSEELPVRDESPGNEQPAIPQLPGETADPHERLEAALTTVLGAAFVLALLGTAFVAVSPPAVGSAYTELYLLNDQGVAADYPTNVTAGEESTVLVGVANHERATVEYELVVSAGDQTLASESLTLSDGQRWEEPVSYAIDEPGATEVAFRLYRGGDSSTDADPYRSARLVVNVME